MVKLSDFLEPAFTRTSVIQMYPMVEDARKALGFTAPENNAAVMKQVTYVTKEFRKQQEKLHGPIIKIAETDKAKDLLDVLMEKRESWDGYPTDEDMALYMCLRDIWMNNLIGMIQSWINTGGNPYGEFEEEYWAMSIQSLWSKVKDWLEPEQVLVHAGGVLVACGAARA